MRILLVEDEALIALDLEAILNRLGHQVVAVAETRDEAIQFARETSPDAALVDVKLRDGYTGVETAKRLSEDFGLHCAFVTGNPEQVHGPFTVVDKPFTPLTIDTALRAFP